MPTQVAVCQTALSSAVEAGAYLSSEVLQKLGGLTPDVLIVFASPQYCYPELLAALNLGCRPAILLGCSSAGEFSGCSVGNGSASVMAIKSDEMRFNASLGQGLRSNRADALQKIGSAFIGHLHADFPYRCALVLTDALAGHADDLVHELTVQTCGTYQLFGGGAADDARFQETHVFYGTEAFGDAVLVLEILSKKPLGIGVKHGWKVGSRAFRVTESEGNCVVSLNAMPVVEVLTEHAMRTGQIFDLADPIPFFLHNVIGIDAGGEHKLRVPLSLNADGSITCAAGVPIGCTVYIMTGSAETASQAAREASLAALAGLQGQKHAGFILFDCAATRLRLGRAFTDELKSVAVALGSDNFAGCNTYGQIARTDGQFSGFHNCTAIVCAIPE
ncbi:MAG: FIST N-terminal domain-containing protein [Pseudomonadota bacterium]